MQFPCTAKNGFHNIMMFSRKKHLLNQKKTMEDLSLLIVLHCSFIYEKYG